MEVKTGNLPSDRESSRLLQPLTLRDLTIRNRCIRAAAFGGSSIQNMKQCHVEVARGGVGMTTIAYTSVSMEGRTFASQLVLTNLSERESSALADMTKVSTTAFGLFRLENPLSVSPLFLAEKKVDADRNSPSPGLISPHTERRQSMQRVVPSQFS